jgi:hypothetical protein
MDFRLYSSDARCGLTAMSFSYGYLKNKEPANNVWIHSVPKMMVEPFKALHPSIEMSSDRQRPNNSLF